MIDQGVLMGEEEESYQGFADGRRPTRVRTIVVAAERKVSENYCSKSHNVMMVVDIGDDDQPNVAALVHAKVQALQQMIDVALATWDTRPANTAHEDEFGAPPPRRNR